MALPFHSNGFVAVSKMPKTILAQVVFGTPNRNCAGSGICKVFTIQGAKRLNISCEMVEARISLLETELQLSFPETACSSQLIQRVFSNEHFKMEEDFVMPSWLIGKFKPQPAFVPQGNYPIQFRNGFIWLKLPLNPF